MDDKLVKVLREIPNGLFLLMSGTGEDLRGMIASWVSQVSGDPPLIMAAVRENRGVWPQIQKSGHFALGLIPQGDPQFFEQLQRPGPQRLQGLELLQGPLGLTHAASALGTLFCRISQVSKPGDHHLILAEPLEAVWNSSGRCLTTPEVGHYYLGGA